MADKNMFEILKQMNIDDSKNGTKHVMVSNHFISADRVKAGAKIAMGAEEECLFHIANNEYIPLLVMVKKDVYFKHKEQ